MISSPFLLRHSTFLLVIPAKAGTQQFGMMNSPQRR
jgi:hypothetical protein